MPAIVNAEMFRTAHAFVSKEETRYYLQGVYVHKHQLAGVLLVVTDGHRMLVIHDKDGSTDLDGVIVKLDKDALAKCKADRREIGSRKLRIEGDGEVTVLADGGETPVASYRNCIIDGTFPDYTRVVPRETSGEPATFNGHYLGDFGKASQELSGLKSGGFRILENGDDPALIRFTSADHAFGVLMPMRDQDYMGTPWFYTAAQEPADTPMAAAT